MVARGGHPVALCHRDATSHALETQLAEVLRQHQAPTSRVVLVAKLLRCPRGCFHLTFIAKGDEEERLEALRALQSEVEGAIDDLA